MRERLFGGGLWYAALLAVTVACAGTQAALCPAPKTPAIPRLPVESYLCPAPAGAVRVRAVDLDYIVVDGRRVECFVAPLGDMPP